MKEYEYSFEVDSLSPYINFCQNHDFTLIEDNHEQRTIFRKEDKTMARITQKGEEFELDFKEDKLDDNELKIRQESLPLKFNDIEAVKSILNFLGYKQDNTLIRQRKVFVKDDVKIELDDYTLPRKTCCVAIEGNPEKVDNIYKLIKK